MANNWGMLRTLVIAVVISGAGLLISEAAGSADPPFAEQAIAQTSSRLDFDVAPLTFARIPSDRAISAALTFVANKSAAIRAVRLARYSNLQKSGVLVWVVDVDGLNQRALGGGLNNPVEKRPIITRATILVDANDGHVDAMYTTVAPPGQP